MMRQVQGGTGKSSQNSLYLHFDLGDTEQVEAISVTFPGGRVITFEQEMPVNTRLWLFENGDHHIRYSSPL